MDNEKFDNEKFLGTWKSIIDVVPDDFSLVEWEVYALASHLVSNCGIPKEISYDIIQRMLVNKITMIESLRLAGLVDIIILEVVCQFLEICDLSENKYNMG